MGLAQSLEKVADNVIDALGADVTIRYVTAGSYNTTTGAIAETESDTNIKGWCRTSLRARLMNWCRRGDKRLIVAAKERATAPETKDRVVISSVVHQIIRGADD